MSLVLTPMKMEAWLRLNGKSSRGLLAIYGSSVLGVLLTLYWTGLVIYHIYFYSLASYLGPLLATSTPVRAWLLVMYLEAIVIHSGKIWRIIRSTRGRIHLAIDEGQKKYGGL
ncbi:hypothetical protein QL093DRAFT_2088180 [Fusarium oxysporum]|nr:hypothetical protein QL093DRAFT_2088180 [Fusarium oxysporum]